MVRPTIIAPKIRKQNRFLKPASSAVGSDGSFLSLPTQEKTCFSHIPLHRCCESSPHRTPVTTKLGRAHAPLSRDASLPSLRVVGGRCLEVFPGTWEPDPFLDDFFLIGNDLLFCIAEGWYRTGSAPHAPSETSRQRPPTALKTWQRGLSA